MFLCLIFQSEKGFQDHCDDRPDDQTDDADTFETEIHGEQGQQRMQTDLCAKDFWLQNLSHDLNDAIECHISDSKEGIPRQKMDDRSWPEDETAAEEGQGVDDGDDDTQQDGIRGAHHQHGDNRNGEGEAHQDELGFNVAPDRRLQFFFCGIDGKTQQRCNVFLIFSADEVSVFGEEVSGDQCYEESDEEVGYAANGTTTAAFGQQRKERTCSIILELEERCLQFRRQFCAEGIELVPEFLQPYFKDVYIVGKVFRNILNFMNDTVSRPEPQKPQKGKQNQNTQESADAAGNTVLLQFISQWIEQQAHQPADDKGQENR